MTPRSPRPGKLRTQVLAGVLLITLGTLAVFDVAAVTALRTYLISQTDGTLKLALNSTRPQLPRLLPEHRKTTRSPGRLGGLDQPNLGAGNLNHN